VLAKQRRLMVAGAPLMGWQISQSAVVLPPLAVLWLLLWCPPSPAAPQAAGKAGASQSATVLAKQRRLIAAQPDHRRQHQPFLTFAPNRLVAGAPLMGWQISQSAVVLPPLAVWQSWCEPVGYRAG
jgi:uncharacterized membrane protein YqaE (UPF0057 family)